jgi:glycosyltransferase involved in cell wall biosynthesis
MNNMQNEHKKRKLAIIGTVGVPACYGGFETLAEQLVRHLADEFEVTVYNSTKNYAPDQRPKTWKGAKLVWLPIKANGLGGIFYDFCSILHAIFVADALLILGVSGAAIFPAVKFFTNKKIIINIDGLEWARQKWGRAAKWFLRWSESTAVRWADEVITDNAAIQKYALERYGVHSRLITYGGDQAKTMPLSPEILEKHPWTARRYAFSVCRIEPENNIHLLLEAFSKTGKMPIAIVGNWEISDYSRRLYRKYANHHNIKLFSPIFDLKVLNQLRANAAIYMHGHSAGGTNPSLVEAMHLGIPIFAFDAIFNRVTTFHEAFYFSDVKELRILLQCVADCEFLEFSGKTMLEIAQKNYTWAKITQQYADLMYDKKVENTPVFDFDIPIALRKTLELV